jgi:hypothetical protein
MHVKCFDARPACGVIPSAEASAPHPRWTKKGGARTVILKRLADRGEIRAKEGVE